MFLYVILSIDAIALRLLFSVQLYFERPVNIHIFVRSLWFWFWFRGNFYFGPRQILRPFCVQGLGYIISLSIIYHDRNICFLSPDGYTRLMLVPRCWLFCAPYGRCTLRAVESWCVKKCHNGQDRAPVSVVFAVRFLPARFGPLAVLCTAALYVLRRTVNGIRQRPYFHYNDSDGNPNSSDVFRYLEREATSETKADLRLLTEYKYPIHRSKPLLESWMTKWNTKCDYERNCWPNYGVQDCIIIVFIQFSVFWYIEATRSSAQNPLVYRPYGW